MSAPTRYYAACCQTDFATPTTRQEISARVDRMLDLIGQTTTTTGLSVQAHLVTAEYPTGLKVSDADMETLNLQPHEVCPQWNYTIRPRQSQAG